MGGHPLAVGVADLVRAPGSRKRVHRAVVLDGLTVSTAEVTAGQEVAVDLDLESIAGGIVASGTVRVPWTGACRRCLEPVRDVAVAEVREIFDRHPVEGETYPFRGDVVELGPMVHDAALLVLPLAPLCADGCRGPDPEAFPTGAVPAPGSAGDGGSPGDGPAGPGAPRGAGRDDRWAALDQLRFDD